MKLTLIFTMLVFLTFENGFSQAKVTLHFEKATIQQVLKTLEDQTGHVFLYKDDIFDPAKKYSVDFTDEPFKEVLKSVCETAGVDYEVRSNRQIILTEKVRETVTTISLQQRTVTGVVTDSRGEPLPGVTVLIPGTTTGTVTNADGNFTLSIPDGTEILQFSFVGMRTQEVPVNGKSTVNIVLSENIQSIDEIVVTALSIERNKNSLGYSITQINSDEITQAKENNPINSLAGKVAGLQITKAPTGVDGSSRVVLRGVASLLGNNRPLFVIDGIPMDAGYGGGGRWGGKDSGDALADLNPEDIETMSVLKGAGAAAAYGSRGANGVILVTTKKGKSRIGTGFSYSSGFTVETPMVTPDFQYDYAQGAFNSYPTMNGSRLDHPWIWSYGPKMEGQAASDWLGKETRLVKQPNLYDEFFRTGSTFTNTVAFDGGNETISFRASVTNQDSKGIMPNNGLSRQTINFRGSSKLGEKISFDGKITYIRSKVENQPYLAEDGANIVQALNILPRSVSLQSLKNNVSDAYGNELKWTVDNTFSNPYWVLNNIKNTDEKNRLQVMYSMNWNVAKKLKLMIRSGFDYTNTNGKDWEAPGRQSIHIGRGSISQGISNGIEWNTDMLTTYDQKFKDFNINISAGGNYRYNQGNSISQWGNVERVPNFFNVSNYKNFGTSEWYSKKAVYSAYGLGTFSFKNYLYIDVTARNDWSSTLPLTNNSYFYHSENLSFLFTEAFAINNNILNTGKIRASYAKVGNDTGAYQIDQYYNIVQTQTEYPLAGIGGQLPHFDLQPEETKSWEIGTNLGFFQNRLVVDATYYYSISDNQIMNVDLTPSTGYSSKKMNAGKIENSGYELQVSGNPVSVQSGVNWDVTLTWSKNKSIVRELYGDMQFLPLAAEFHMTLEAHIDQPYGVIYAIDYKRDAFGNKLIDKNGYAQAGKRKALGDINPDWMGGISNRISYKGLMLSFLIDIQKGGNIYSWGKAYRGLFGTSAETLEGRAEWNAGTGGFVEKGIKESNGQPNDIAIEPTYRWYNLYNKQIGTEWVMEASNIRMREMVLSWSLPQKWLLCTPVSNINFSLVGRNLFFFYNAMGDIDPESGYSSGNTGSGIEHMSLPSTSSYGANLKINF